ncbi:hypothetical protein N0V83_002888 [Neocucurbitaria cava]|uniref:IBR domain-containing protein n=1 Tax=Neocucurbitaria cava TaxID=798079 RepID=A0A9W9CPY7_9PLEO|nr:hypothetical protein N0V83_002888 [Neocucurbitaria cava]
MGRPPNRKKKAVVKDPLIERFETLRLPQRGKLKHTKQPSSNSDRDAVAVQEVQGQRTAPRLQEFQNSAHDALSAQSVDQSRSNARRYPWQKCSSRTKSPGTSLKQDGPHSGTRENPINLDSDSDSDSIVPNIREIELRVHVEDYGGLYGEPMELDDTSSDSNLGEIESIVVAREAEKRTLDVARQLQAEEDSNVRTAQGSPVFTPQELAQAAIRNGSPRSFKQYAQPAVFQQYDTFIARAAFSEDPNFRWCRNCDFGQIHISGVEGNIFTCGACGHKVCVIHESKNTWHEGETCEEYEYRSSGQKERDQKAQEAASLQAIGKLSKKCPGPNCVYNIGQKERRMRPHEVL